MPDLAAVPSRARIRHRARAVVAAALGTLLATTSPALAQGLMPGAKPVAPECLHGRTLTAEEENFSLEAPPGDDWKWVSLPVAPSATWSHGYACVNEHARLFFIVNIDVRRYDRITEKGARDLAAGLATGITKKGGTLSGQTLEPASIPVPGESYRMSYDVTVGGGVAHGYAYSASPGMLFTLQCVTLDRTEPVAFTEFARSFRLLKDPSFARGEAVGRAIGGLLCPLLIGAVVIFFVFFKGKRPAPRPPQAFPNS